MSAKGDSQGSREDLRFLSEHYYEPVLAYLQRVGRDRDIVHDYFNYLLEGNRLDHLERERAGPASIYWGHLSTFWPSNGRDPKLQNAVEVWIRCLSIKPAWLKWIVRSCRQMLPNRKLSPFLCLKSIRFLSHAHSAENLCHHLSVDRRDLDMGRYLRP